MVNKISGNVLPEEVENGVAVIDFSATWCSPCRMLAPVLDEISEDMAGKMKFYNADVDENPYLAQKYGITSIPALVIIKDGEQKDIQVGFQPKANLVNIFEKYV